MTSTAVEREAILSDITHLYRQLMSEWRRSEVTHQELMRVAEGSRESSPTLSSVRPSPPTVSPLHHGNTEASPVPSSEEMTPVPATPIIATPTLPDEDHFLLKLGLENGLTNGHDHVIPHEIPPMSCDHLKPMDKLDERGLQFVQELYNIDKDIPRCDRDYWSVNLSTFVTMQCLLP